MRRIWGATSGTQSHGGVIPENVMKAENGDILIAVNGDYYAGDKKGVNLDDPDYPSADGKSTGGVIISKESYGPGSFEVVMKIPSVNGVCTSMWLYNYWESGGIANNHEIDIELHGTVGEQYSEHGVGTYRKALCTGWLTESDKHSDYADLGYALNDGQFHKYRIDWHTGDSPRILYYIDDTLVCTQTQYVPTNEMFLNIGCWFPENWCGVADFETDTMAVRSFKYTPFAGETATKSNTSANVAGSRYYAIPASGYGFESNLIANGALDADRTGDGFVWNVAGVTSGTAAGGSAFTGEISQDVYIDCGGLDLELALAGAGAATVTVEYGSIVDGVQITGSKTFGYSGGAATFEFTPPANCTKLTVKISSADGVTLDNVTLRHAP